LHIRITHIFSGGDDTSRRLTHTCFTSRDAALQTSKMQQVCHRSCHSVGSKFIISSAVIILSVVVFTLLSLVFTLCILLAVNFTVGYVFFVLLNVV